MRIKNFLTLILLLIFIQTKSQTPNWVWARSAQSGISGAGEGMAATTDTYNNVFIGGWFGDSISFGSYFFNYANGAYLAKYDSSGNLKWAKCGACLGTNQGIGTGVYTDAFGNSYLTGWFSGTIVFDSDTLTCLVPLDIFIVKYDSNGNLIWAKSIVGTSLFYPSLDIALDKTGNIYLASSFYSQFIFASDTLNSSGTGANYFLAKCDSSGNPLWARSANQTCGGSQSYSVATDASENIYLSGAFGSASCSMILGSDTLVSLGNSNIFIAKYDSSGNVLWAKSAGGSNSDGAYYIATDTIGSIYLTGSFSSTSISFDSHTLTNNSGNGDSFLAKYDSSGNAIWAKSIGGFNLIGYCVATDKQNKIYVCGGSYQPTDTTVTFDSLTLYYPTGAIDPSFIAGYNSSGQILFAKILASGADDQNAVAVSPSGSIYMGGDFYQVNPFIVGNDSLSLIGQENVFVAKLSYSTSNGISEIGSNKECMLFPNPFNDNLHIFVKENEQTEIILYDILSRKLFRQTFTNSIILNTSQLAKGIYIYEVRDKNGLCKKGKVVKD